ncbi:MAG: ThiF family adenylyltransferase [Gracilibacteraceae bacterium]|jgi:adenylyltransferase/sulfurtransferase|nr:ThiF family adenylyltransferase [Gracilibacteraceae bacterium]
MSAGRYSRQELFAGVGGIGQEKLSRAKVAVVGLGALGTVAADSLCRAGVGFLRLVDRDCVELSNLQRQTLFTEEDAREERPKAVAAARRLAAVNSAVTAEPLVADVNAGNIGRVLAGVDLALDGSDNFETRYLLNEACHSLGLPWIYAGALGGEGGTMNILPGGPCFRCLAPAVPAPGSYPTCGTAGALNMVTGIVALYQAAEAVKILLGSPETSRSYLSVDIWRGTERRALIRRNPDCPVCGRGEYEFLTRRRDAGGVSLCGQEAVQIVPGAPAELDLPALAAELRRLGAVKLTPFMLSFEGPVSFRLFPDGRAVIQNVTTTAAAKSVYAEYIGL